MNLVVLTILALNFVQPAFAAETATKQPTVMSAQTTPNAQKQAVALVDNKNLVATGIATPSLPKDTSGITFTPVDQGMLIQSKDGSVIGSARGQTIGLSFCNSQSCEIVKFDAASFTTFTATQNKQTGALSNEKTTALDKDPYLFKANLEKLRSMLNRVIGTSTGAELSALLKMKASLTKAIDIASRFIQAVEASGVSPYIK